MKIRIRKDGKPYAQDLKQARKEVKENFAFYKSFQGENLPPQVQGYFRQIDGAKEAAKGRIHNPETGRFFGKKQNSVIKNALEKFAINTGQKFEDLKNFKDIVRDVYNIEVKRSSIKMVPADIIKDEVKNKSYSKIFILDQKGNRTEVSATAAIKALTDSNKIAMRESGGFNPTHETKLNLITREFEIFILNFDGMKEEKIKNTINKAVTNGEYNLSKSDPKEKRKRRKAARERKNKKQNKPRRYKKSN